MTPVDPLNQPARWHTAISETVLSIDDANAFVADPRAGATVTFTGVVRNHALDDSSPDDTQLDDGPPNDSAPNDSAPNDTQLDGVSGSRAVRPVTGMDYEAYTEVAERRLTELADEVSAKWPDLCAGWAEHRVGRLAVGDTAVVVAVSSPHRDTAFEAGRHLIDTLKATVPIWKKEHWADGGSHWPGTD